MQSMSEPTELVEAKRPGFKIIWVIGLALLAIAGVIAAVGVTVYDDFTHRANVSEAISMLTGARTGLAIEFQDREKWPENLDKVVNTISGTYTESIRITKGAGGVGEVELTATMRTTGVDRSIAGKTILMVSSDGGKNWTCKPGTMPLEYLPPNCRN